jgi:hypothetical protein
MGVPRCIAGKSKVITVSQACLDNVMNAAGFGLMRRNCSVQDMERQKGPGVFDSKSLWTPKNIGRLEGTSVSKINQCDIERNMPGIQHLICSRFD